MRSFVCLVVHRPEMDTEWTYIREPIETNSMVLKGLLPETEYQFVVRAVNMHGASPPSHINNPVRTLSKSRTSIAEPNVLRCDSQESLSLSSLVSLVSTTFQNKVSFSTVSTIHPHRTKQTMLIFCITKVILTIQHLSCSTAVYKSQRYCGDSFLPAVWSNGEV